MRYVDLEPVAVGGMAEVYRAWDPVHERPVALKVLRWGDRAMVDRLLGEARAQARVRHPNVCEVYEVGEDDRGRPFIAMRYVAGEPIHQMADELDLESKVAVMRQVAEAVHHAHAIGLVHRDLKPGNILVEPCEDGRWKPFVVDFGLASEHAQALRARTGQVMGTPSYMAPELAAGDVQRIDRRTDVYSLGAVLYELFTGQPPFAADTVERTLRMVRTQAPRPPRTVDPTLPEALEAITLRCLEKNPSDRYRSARELADDLGRYLASEPVAARLPSPSVRLKRFARRHPIAASLGAAAILIAAALGGRSLEHLVVDLAHARGERDGALVRLADRTSETARLYRQLGDRATARARFEEVIALRRRLVDLSPSDPATVALARDLMAFGRLEAADGETDGAAAHWLEAAALTSEAARDREYRPAQAVWAISTLLLGRTEEAAPTIRLLLDARWDDRTLRELADRAGLSAGGSEETGQ